MVPAIDVARYLIRLAGTGESADGVCHMRLQKLLYYVQGWHLAIFDTPLFSGRIEAWTFGPVVGEVYPRFKEFGYQILPYDQSDEPASLDATSRAFVRAVWEEYKKYSASGLSEMTHQEAPWLNARGTIGPDECSSEEITSASMLDFFASQLKNPEGRLVPGIPVRAAYEALEQFDRGDTKTHEEVFRKLRSA